MSVSKVLTVKTSKIQVVVMLRKLARYAAMNRVRLFVRGDPSLTTQTPYYSGLSSTWIVSGDENRSSFEFDEVSYISKHLRNVHQIYFNTSKSSRII